MKKKSVILISLLAALPWRNSWPRGARFTKSSFRKSRKGSKAKNVAKDSSGLGGIANDSAIEEGF